MGKKTSVKQTRVVNYVTSPSISRRRKCLDCGVFRTVEIPVNQDVDIRVNVLKFSNAIKECQ